jgi:hypothetical protein
MSKLRLCLSNVTEMFNVVFLLNPGLSPSNPTLHSTESGPFFHALRDCPPPFFTKAIFQILCVNFSMQTVMRNDSADDLERLDAANLHCEMHYLLFSIPHTNLTTL